MSFHKVLFFHNLTARLTAKKKSRLSCYKPCNETVAFLTVETRALRTLSPTDHPDILLGHWESLCFSILESDCDIWGEVMTCLVLCTGLLDTALE